MLQLRSYVGSVLTQKDYRFRDSALAAYKLRMNTIQRLIVNRLRTDKNCTDEKYRERRGNEKELICTDQCEKLVKEAVEVQCTPFFEYLNTGVRHN